MPILPHAKKALRASQRNRIVNQRLRSRVKTMMDKMRRQPNQENLAQADEAIQKAVKKGIFKPNKGARLQAQMVRLLS